MIGIATNKRHNAIHKKVIKGDWIARLGEESTGDDTEQYGLGARNARGNCLVHFRQGEEFIMDFSPAHTEEHCKKSNQIHQRKLIQEQMHIQTTTCFAEH